MKCKATKRNGESCTNQARTNSDYCGIHNRRSRVQNMREEPFGEGQIELSRQQLLLEQQRLEYEIRDRDAELGLEKSKHDLHVEELAIKRYEVRHQGWRSPLFLAVLAAAIAAAGNAFVTYIGTSAQQALEKEKSGSQIRLEERKAEAARILEMLKTNDPDKAAENLKFLTRAKLISEPKRSEILEYLSQREPGSGPSLPTDNQSGSTARPYDRVIDLPSKSIWHDFAKRAGRITTHDQDGKYLDQCRAVLIGPNHLLAYNCIEPQVKKIDFIVGEYTMEPGFVETHREYQVNASPLYINVTKDVALLHVEGQPGNGRGYFEIEKQPPAVGETIYLLWNNGESYLSSIDGCMVTAVHGDYMSHNCESAISQGGAIISKKSRKLIGIHTGRVSTKSGSRAIIISGIFDEISEAISR